MKRNPGRSRGGLRLASVALTVLATHMNVSPVRADATVGLLAPDFELETTDAEVIALRDFRGSKVVYLNLIGYS